jgi:hypothetical protein
MQGINLGNYYFGDGRAHVVGEQVTPEGENI